MKTTPSNLPVIHLALEAWPAPTADYCDAEGHAILAAERIKGFTTILGQTCGPDDLQFRNVTLGAGFTPIEKRIGIWRIFFKCARKIRGYARLFADRRMHCRDIVAPDQKTALDRLAEIEGPGARSITVFDIDCFKEMENGL